MKTRIKLIQLIHGFPTGGAENLVKQYCQLFDEENIDLIILALHNHHSIFDKELEKSRLKIIYVDDVIDRHFDSFPDIVKKVMHRLFRKALVRSYIRNIRPDVIHYHLPLSEYIKKAKPNKGTKIFLTVHSEPKSLWNDKTERRKDKSATCWLIKNYSFKFIALHEKMREEINEMFGVDDTLVLNNGVQYDRFLVKESKDIIKKRLLIPENTVVIGHIGRFVAVKNHKFIVNIFDEFLRMHPNSILLFVGVGELQEEIKKMVDEKGLSGKVKFLGVRSDIPEILHIIDVILFPSVYEGMPVSLIEAQVSRTPCLVSDSITQEVKISNLLFFESLEQTAKIWAEKLDKILEMEIYPEVDNDNWDLCKSVRMLEEFYGESMQ